MSGRPAQRGPNWLRFAAVLGLCAIVAALAASYLVAGPAGVALTGTVLAVVTLVAGRTVTAGATAGPRSKPAPDSAPARRSRRARGARRWGRGQPAASPGAADVGHFRAYRQILSQLSFAAVSGRHFDYVTRPRLLRIASAVLDQRCGVDLERQPDRARELIGPDVWPLLDPGRPNSEDANARGVDLATIAEVIDRLERL